MKLPLMPDGTIYYHSQAEIAAIASEVSLEEAQRLHKQGWDAGQPLEIEKWSRVVHYDKTHPAIKEE